MVTKKKPQSSETSSATVKEEHNDGSVQYDSASKSNSVDPTSVPGSSTTISHHMNTGANLYSSGGGATVDIKVPQHSQSAYITGPTQSAYVPYGASAASYYQDYNSYSRSVSEFYDSWKLPMM